MFMTKRSLMKCSFLAAFLFSVTNTYLFSDQNYDGASNSNESYGMSPQVYNSQNSAYQNLSYQSSYAPQGNLNPPAECQGGSCKAQGQYQGGTCQGGSCAASASQQPNSCQGGSCNMANQQNGTCLGGKCHDHYGSHNGEPYGWHYPHPDYPRNVQFNGQNCGQNCNQGACNGADNGSYVQNCQSGACNSAHRPDQYNVNYNGYPYDCSYNSYTYPYDGNWYYSVHPWLDGF